MTRPQICDRWHSCKITIEQAGQKGSPSPLKWEQRVSYCYHRSGPMVYSPQCCYEAAISSAATLRTLVALSTAADAVRRNDRHRHASRYFAPWINCRYFLPDGTLDPSFGHDEILDLCRQLYRMTSSQCPSRAISPIHPNFGLS